MKDMANITGDKSQVIIFHDFTKLRENFLEEFKKKFCGKLRLLRKEQFWNHVAVFMIK